MQTCQRSPGPPEIQRVSNDSLLQRGAGGLSRPQGMIQLTPKMTYYHSLRKRQLNGAVNTVISFSTKCACYNGTSSKWLPFYSRQGVSSPKVTCYACFPLLSAVLLSSFRVTAICWLSEGVICMLSCVLSGLRGDDILYTVRTHLLRRRRRWPSSSARCITATYTLSRKDWTLFARSEKVTP